MSSLFSVPTTPSSQSRSSRSRYNSDTGSTHSHSYPSNVDSTLTQTPTPTHTQPRHHTNSVSSARSQKTPKGIIDYGHHHNNNNNNNTLTGSPLSASPTRDSRTPFVQPALPPSPQHSPAQMPAYHPSPSPTATYGINGGLIVSSNAPNMPSGNGSECQPLLPNQPDVFMNGKTGRPVLRPTLSHNTVLSPTSVNWNRRSGAEEPTSAHRSNTAESGLVYNTTQSGTNHHQHEASAPYPQHSVATHSSYPPAPPPPSSHPHSSSHTQSQSMSINSGNPYSDQELSFQTASYSGSYDSSFGSNSPWTASPHIEQSGYPQYPYGQMPVGRIDEPILAPGEVPAPRPPVSYAALIGEALLLAPAPHQLYVSEISESIKRRYVYYRQNPTKVYNGVRHQTSMCKAFVKLSRPFGDQSGGARKWAIRAGCETWFANGGCRQPSAADKRMSISPPPGNKAGKAKATARAKQLAIGTGGYHQRSPKMSHKVKQESYSTNMPGGPSTGPAFDGVSRPAYAPYHHPYGYPAQSHLQSYPPGYHYLPIPHNIPHPPPHPMMQSYQYQNNGGYQVQPPAGSPSEDASPLMTPAGHSAPHPYPQYAYAQPGPQQYWNAPPGDHSKPSYSSMPPPPAHAYTQSDERNSSHEQHSPGSYDGQHSPHGMRGRDVELSLSPTQ